MSSELQIDFGVAALAIALASLVASMWFSLNRQMGDITRQMTQRMDRMDQQMTQRMDRMDQRMDDIRDRLARLEVIVDFIRLGMQLPRPPELAAEGPKEQ